MNRTRIPFPALAAAALLAGSVPGCDSAEDGPRPEDFIIAVADIECPPQHGTEGLAANLPVQDVDGLRPGMNFDHAVALLACRGDLPEIEFAPLWNLTENFGVPTRQLVRASDGRPCSEEEALASPAVCEDAGGRLRPLRDFTQEIAVVFTGMPGEERAQAVWRHQSFPAEDGPAVADVVASLHEKYGVPHVDRSAPQFYVTRTRPGAVNLYWLYDEAGQPVRRPDAGEILDAHWYRACINDPMPWFETRRTWNRPDYYPRTVWSEDCGLTIRAEIIPTEGDAPRAQEVNVMVMNQTDLSRETERFKARLREQSAEESARPGM